MSEKFSEIDNQKSVRKKIDNQRWFFYKTQKPKKINNEIVMDPQSIRVRPCITSYGDMICRRLIFKTNPLAACDRVFPKPSA